MKRRAFLAAGAIATTGCMGTVSDELAGAQADVKDLNDGPGMTQKFPLSGNFEKVEFQSNGDLVVYIDTSGNMLGFALTHASQSSRGSWIDNWYLEDFVPEKTIRFMDQIVDYIDDIDGASEYPSRDFKLVAYKDYHGLDNIAGDTIGSVTVTVPKEIAPARIFADVE